MEIRLSSPKYKEKMYSLWQSCFGDDRETIDMFLKTAFLMKCGYLHGQSRGCVTTVFASGKALTRRKGVFCILYLCSRHRRELQKQGIMGSLLEFTSALAADRKVDYLFWFRRLRTFLIITKNSAFIKLSMPKNRL